MYPVMLEEIGLTLKLSKKELESDIKDIAEYWETCLEKAQIEERDTAIFLLTTCVTCYLRGRGIRIGNYKSFKDNHGILVSLVTLIPLFAWKQPAKYYPRIHEIIPIFADNGNTENKGVDIISEAEKILREKGID
jgi:hypothetical protein